MTDTCKYPNIKVELIGQDGNAFFILGKVSKALRAGGVSPEEVKTFMDTATSGDYNHLLATVMEWVEITGEDRYSDDDDEDEDDEDDDICPDCGESLDWCECDEEDETCLECGESLSDCICDDEDYDEQESGEIGEDDEEESDAERHADILKDCGN